MSLFGDLFRILDSSGTRYVVVGGVATVLHGHARLTADLDLVVDLDPKPARRLIETLVKAGFQSRLPVDPLDFADPEARKQWIEEKHVTVFTMSDPQNPLRSIDLFVSHAIEFEGLWQRAERMTIEGTGVPVASIPDLVRLKEVAPGERHREDIEKLLEIEQLRKRRPK